MGLLDRDIVAGRQTVTPTRTSTRNPTRRTLSPIQPRAVDYALRHPDAVATFDPNPRPVSSAPISGGERTYTAGPVIGPGVGPGGVPDAVGTGAGANDRLTQLRDERLQAALEAIGANFDLQEGGLNKQLAMLKTFFDRSMRENTREEGFTREGINEGSVERGLFRSGIRMKNLLRGLIPFQEQRADLIGQLNPEKGAEGTQVRDIMSLIELLQPQEERAKAGAKLDAEKDELDLSQLIALITSGLG